MFNTYRKVLVIAGLVFCLFSSVFAYSGGSGTVADPYLIATPADLNSLGATPSHWGKCFKLVADINMAEFTGTQYKIIGTSYDYSFRGIFDGDGYVIRNLTYTTTASMHYVGLFGYVGSGGQIRNLGVKDVNIIGGGYVGGLVGQNYNGNITNSYATGSVLGRDSKYGCAGGLVGQNNDGDITACYATGTIDGREKVGGLVGGNSGTIINCYATGAVNGNYGVGGLAGYNGGGATITNCYAAGAVNGKYEVGGLAGDNGGTVTNCYATGAVNGNYGVGGLAGYNGGGATITNCYAAGAVDGNDYVGGLIGLSYNGNIIACFWDIETSGRTTSAGGGRGLTTSQMKSVIFYQNAGWADNGWVINDSVDYPRLAWENTGGVPIPQPQPQPIPLSGSGTEEDPYQVWTAEDFALLSWYVSVQDKHFTLMADLDLSGIILYPIGDSGFSFTGFSGVFDGNGHTIRNVNINMPGSNNIGLFASVNPGGQVRNLHIEDVHIIGGNYVGGLAGMSDGNITNCYVTGVVTGNSDYVGGLTGVNHGRITACYTAGTISGGEHYIGGLTGVNSGRITACYTAGGSASGGGNCVGGLIGWNGGDVIDCYSTDTANGIIQVGGLIGYNENSTVTDCYAVGAVTGGTYVGGLIGMNLNYGRITACYSTGTTDGGGNCVGGLIGCNSGDVIDCYSTDTVNGAIQVGGLVGYNYDGGSISNCYSTGAINGYSGVGGLVGWNYGAGISNCYSTSAVSGDSNVGGLVGDGNGVTTVSFWDVNTSGQTTSAGGEGKTTTEMQTLSTFTSAGWDFSYTDGDKADWFIQIDEYPILTWQISPADIYTDGKNNFRDFAIFAQYWMREDCAIYNYYCDWADLDFNGSVDIDDLIILMSYWLQSGIYN